jgi:ABC-type nitrate/sulfonate/bicarbonate transport system permease component
MTTQGKSFARGPVISIGVIAALLFTWQLAIVAFAIPPYILPTPLAVGKAFITSRKVLADHAAFTLGSALLGLFASCCLAIGLAITFVSYRSAAKASMPLVIIFRSAPVTAIAPLITLFAGRGLATSVIVVVIVSFFPIMVNMMRGLLSADVCAIELLHVYGASRWQNMRYVRAPYSLPFLFAGLRVAAASAVLGAMLSEWVTGSPGLGVLILESGVMREIEVLWAAVLTSVAFALLLFFLTSAAENKVLHWKRAQGA